MIKCREVIFEQYSIETMKALSSLIESENIDPDDYAYNILSRYFHSTSERELMYRFISDRIILTEESTFFKELYIKVIAQFGKGTVE